MLEATANHKFKFGMYGVRLPAPRGLDICRSRLKPLQRLFASLVQLSKQSGVKFALALGSLISYKRFGDVMPWDLDGDVYFSSKDEKRLVRFILAGKAQLPASHVLVVRDGYCPALDPIFLLDQETGFYIDLSRLRVDAKTVKHATYSMPINKYYPLKKCKFAGLELWCPNDVDAFLTAPWRPYGVRTIKLHPTLAPCPYFKHLNNIPASKFTFEKIMNSFFKNLTYA
jgi:hypothetical protein